MEDVVSATCASLCITPAVTLVDRAIVQTSAGQAHLLKYLSEGFLEVARQPFEFFRG